MPFQALINEIHLDFQALMGKLHMLIQALIAFCHLCFQALMGKTPNVISGPNQVLSLVFSGPDGKNSKHYFGP